MKNYKIILFGIGILLFGSSCSKHYYYSSHSNHHTQISDKGEITASAAVGKAGFDNYENDPRHKDDQIQVQAAYSPIKHLAVSSSVSFSEPSNKSTSLSSTQGYDADFAVGSYFFAKTNLAKENSPESLNIRESGFLFDAYLTYGRGRMINSYRLGTSDIFAYNRYGMQFGVYYRTRPSIGRFSTSFSMGMIVRPAVLEFSNALVIGPSSNTSSFLNLINTNNRFRINEYTLTGQLGVGGVRLFGNINWTTSKERELYRYIDDEAIQMGVLFEVDRLFNLKKKKKPLSKSLLGL